MPIKHKIIPTILLASTLSLFGANIKFEETNGATYDIVEKDVIELIHKHINDNKEDIDKRLEVAEKQLKEKTLSYRPKDLSIKLFPAREDKIFYPNPEYILDRDIKDANGKVMYPKGFKFNPLHYISLTDKYVFIDYEAKEQVQWLLKNNFHKELSTKIIITNGKVFDAMKQFKREVFYVNDLIINRFELSNTPSVVQQEQDRIRVEQFYLKKD